MSAGPARNLAVYHDHEGFTTLWSSKSFAIMKSRLCVRIVATDRGSRAREPGRAVPTGCIMGRLLHQSICRRIGGRRGCAGGAGEDGEPGRTPILQWALGGSAGIVL